MKLRIRDWTYEGKARPVTDPSEDAMVRRMLLDKYATPEQPLTEWGQTAYPVAIELMV